MDDKLYWDEGYSSVKSNVDFDELYDALHGKKVPRKKDIDKLISKNVHEAIQAIWNGLPKIDGASHGLSVDFSNRPGFFFVCPGDMFIEDDSLMNKYISINKMIKNIEGDWLIEDPEKVEQWIDILNKCSKRLEKYLKKLRKATHHEQESER